VMYVVQDFPILDISMTIQEKEDTQRHKE
jgi:hypothetical protein